MLPVNIHPNYMMAMTKLTEYGTRTECESLSTFSFVAPHEVLYLPNLFRKQTVNSSSYESLVFKPFITFIIQDHIFYTSNYEMVNTTMVQN